FGRADRADSWRTAVEQHARWLGLQFTPSVWSQPDGKLFICAWLSTLNLAIRPHIHTTDEIIEVGTRYDARDNLPWQAERDPNEVNEARLRWVRSRGELSVMVQPLSPEQMFYTASANGIALSNDLRLLIRLTGLDLDERAVFSLLQYGAILPPFSISRQIQRIPNGHTLQVRTRQDGLTGRVETGEWLQRKTPPLQGIPPTTALRQTLDGILEATPHNSALFFSGGVDSGLMAARLAALGRRDVRLINFSFGPDDEESVLAHEMAGYLGMQCELIPYDQSQCMGVLWRAAEDYSVPFGDYSVLPMNMMIHAALGPGTQTASVIEGAGADDLFSAGLNYSGWRRLYQLPWAARAAIGSVYKAGSVWRVDSRIARVGRVLRRSAQMHLLLAGAYAQNSLDGIAYRMPDAVREQLDAAFAIYRLGPVYHLPREDQFSLTMVMHESAGRVAAKSLDPLRKRGIAQREPFLEPTMMRLALSLPWDQKSAGGEPKALLKELLAEHVPHEMVYRRKSAFVPPYDLLLTTEPMQAYLHEVVLSPSSPLAPYVDQAVVERMTRESQEWSSLNLEVYFFLWSLTFLTAWLYPIYRWQRDAKQAASSGYSA
ncbi:MAG TPA: asparagine synthase C-terminal domain-containing protein, partial [Ktedonobacterales bacterium]|nr:asparagine synthase C-terminal domain-containing protein [Ktedonobacterales bacterium]